MYIYIESFRLNFKYEKGQSNICKIPETEPTMLGRKLRVDISLRTLILIRLRLVKNKDKVGLIGWRTLTLTLFIVLVKIIVSTLVSIIKL